MFVIKCILSGLLALVGASFLLETDFAGCLLSLLFAALFFPYEAANGIVCGWITVVAGGGIAFLLSGSYYEGFLCIGIAVIIWIKGIRLYRKENCFHIPKIRSGRYGGYSGYSRGGSGSGTYSSGSDTYSSDSDTYGSGSYDYAAERERRQREEEERRRQLDEERQRHLDEERRRRQEAFEAENRRLEAEKLSQRKYGCSADVASNWDRDIRNRL